MNTHTTYPPDRIRMIQTCVADFYGLALKDMVSTKRARHVSRPRMMAMFLSRELSALSFPVIARAFNRDHTTVLHAVRTITAMLRQYPELQTEKAEMIKRINSLQGIEAVNTGSLYLSVSPPKSGAVNA